MPAQWGPRGDQARAARVAWRVATRRREPGPIRGMKARPRHPAAQDLKRSNVRVAFWRVAART